MDHALQGLVALALLSALVVLTVLWRMRREASPALLGPFAANVALLDGIGLSLLLGTLLPSTAAMGGTGTLVVDTAIFVFKVAWAVAVLTFARRLLFPRREWTPGRLSAIAGLLLGALLLTGWLEFLHTGRRGIFDQLNTATDYALFLGIILGALWMRSRVAAIRHRGIRRGIDVLTALLIGLFALLCLWWILGGGVRASHPQVRDAFSTGVFLYFNASLAWWALRHGRILSLADSFPEVPPTFSDAVADRYGVSQREREIVSWIVQGKSNKEIAAALFISLHTVKEHVANLLRKTGTKNRVQLTRLFTEPPEERGGSGPAQTG